MRNDRFEEACGWCFLLSTNEMEGMEGKGEREEMAWLTRDIWQMIMERLSGAELARAACVCRSWRAIASDPEVQINAFKSYWKIKHIVGTPCSSSNRSFFDNSTSISRFSISHKLTRSDTLPGLALKYGVHATNIRRLNNMMSDHGIYSRERILIPINDPEILNNQTCYIEMDVYAKREVVVLYLDNAPDAKPGFLAHNVTEKSQRRLIDSMKRSLQADDETAEYYLSISNGDVRVAFQQFSEDLGWEQKHSRE